MVLLGVAVVPAIQALRAGIIGVNVHADLASGYFRLTSRVEELLAERFDDLEAAATAAGGPTVPSSYSDAPGTPDRLLVYLSAYDGDNADADDDAFTGGDQDLLWIRVEAEETVQALQTVTARGY
jgi:hypothetical protein